MLPGDNGQVNPGFVHLLHKQLDRLLLKRGRGYPADGERVAGDRVFHGRARPEEMYAQKAFIGRLDSEINNH
jgi:hypothetical protein